MRFIINILVTALIVFVLSKLLSPHVYINDMVTAIVFALVLAVLNFVVKPLITILTLPLTIVTLGLFLLVINVIIIMLADYFVSGIRIESFLWAFIFGLLLTIVSTLLNKLKKKWVI
ncbi:MAG: phage holin family protein [Ferruginibacter sp.]